MEANNFKSEAISNLKSVWGVSVGCRVSVRNSNCHKKVGSISETRTTLEAFQYIWNSSLIPSELISTWRDRRHALNMKLKAPPALTCTIW